MWNRISAKGLSGFCKAGPNFSSQTVLNHCDINNERRAVTVKNHNGWPVKLSKQTVFNVSGGKTPHQAIAVCRKPQSHEGNDFAAAPSAPLNHQTRLAFGHG